MKKKIHFIGIGGIGMSALAQLHAMSGDIVSGSDRLLSKGYEKLPVFEALKKLGVEIFQQDGSGIKAGLDYIVVSSAIEDWNAELKKAKELNIKIVHRAELLAQEVAANRTIAISGTSGKSTVTAMTYEILTYAGLSPSVITGATLTSLQERGLYGNVCKGDSNILIIEADESDGSLVQYHPEIGVCLNIQRDHKELDVLKSYFKTFAANCKTFISNADEENDAGLFAPHQTFGLYEADTKAENIVADGYGTAFVVDGQNFKLNVPGLHNVQNALAAIAVAKEAGVSLEACSHALSVFKGVYRRFNSVGVTDKIEVIDDFAHNPHKISATLKAAQLRGKRVVAFFQPHAFASVKLLKDDFVEEIFKALRPEDVFLLTEVYYPGGTIPQGVSARDIYNGLLAKGAQNIVYDGCREKLAAQIAAGAKEGDVILVMGARDPGLTAFAKNIFADIGRAHKKPECEKCLINICCMHFNSPS